VKFDLQVSLLVKSLFKPYVIRALKHARKVLCGDRGEYSPQKEMGARFHKAAHAAYREFREDHKNTIPSMTGGDYICDAIDVFACMLENDGAYRDISKKFLKEYTKN